ncbi:MAG TPA: hypothetical protein VF627_11060 [Abditibacterium sp.]
MSQFSHLALLSVLFSSLPLSAQTPTAPAPISVPQRVVGPVGLRREAGTWLFNGSLFVTSGENLVAPNSPVFVANLRRDKKNKLPIFLPAATRGPLNWATLPLPSLRQMSAAGFDFPSLQASLTSQVAAAKAAGRVYVGFSMPGGAGTREPLAATDWEPFRKRLRAVLDAVSPDAALILEVDAATQPQLALGEIDVAAPWCDAVVLRLDPSNAGALWPLKMARRVAEEQTDYDLPIFVAPTAPAIAQNARAGESDLLELFMGGATGFIVPDAQTPSWANQINRNPGLFTGAVTLEDVAILPSADAQIVKFAADLRALGRIPLVGRLAGGDRNGESLIAILNQQTDLATLNGLDKAARGGATIYLEGTPNLSDPAIAAKLADMTSATIEVLPSPKPEVLSLSDPWLFGDVRGQEFAVTQRVKWTPKSTLAAQTRIKKGEPSPLPFSSASLTGDANGLLNAPLGRGRVLWLAHPPVAAKTGDAARRAYLSAVAGNLQSALARVKWASVEEEVRSGGRLHLALRASKLGTPIVALFNEADSDANVSLSARSDGTVALDLSDEKEVATTVVGYSATLPVTVPAHGFRWFTFGVTRKALDKERLTPRPKARTR